MSINEGNPSLLTTASNMPIINSANTLMENSAATNALSIFVNKALDDLKNLTDTYLKPEMVSDGKLLPLYCFISKCKHVLNKTPLPESANVFLKELEERLPAESKFSDTALKVSSCVSECFEHSQDFHTIYEAAVKSLRSQQKWHSEFLVRSLFVSCALADLEASREVLQKGIEIGIELVDDSRCFCESDTYQAVYDHHLCNYLNLLQRYYGYPIADSQNLPHLYTQMCKHLISTLGEERVSSSEEKITTYKNIAFLLSRREWFCALDYMTAVHMLDKAQSESKDILEKHQLLLNSVSIVVEACGAKTNVDDEFLKMMMKTLFQLKVEGKLSTNQFVLASLLQVKIFELLNRSNRQSEKAIINIKEILKDVVKKGIGNLADTNATAMKNYMQCEVLYCFYVLFQYDSKDDLEAVYTNLDKLSESPLADAEMKILAKNLREFFPVNARRAPSKDMPFKLSLMICLRHLLQNNIGRFIYAWYACKTVAAQDFQTDSSKNEISIQCEFSSAYIQAQSDADKEEILWKEFIEGFSKEEPNGSLETMETFINRIGIHHYMKSKKFLAKHYADQKHNAHFRFHTLNYKRDDVNQTLDISFVPQPELVQNMLREGVQYPFFEHLLVEQEDEQLEGNFQLCLMDIINVPGINFNHLIPNRVILFSRVFALIQDELDQQEGQLAYADMSMHLFRVYINNFYNKNSFIEDFFSEDLSHLKKPERQKIQMLRHQKSILDAACKLVIEFHRLNLKWFPHQSSSVVKKTLDVAMRAGSIGMSIAKDNDDKLPRIEETVNSLTLHQGYVEFMKHSFDLQTNDLYMKTFKSMLFECLEEQSHPSTYAEKFYLELPSTLNELRAQYPLIASNSSEIFNLSVAPLLFKKAAYLMSKHNIVGALKVYAEMLDIPEVQKKLKAKKTTKTGGLAFRIYNNPFFIDLNKLKDDDWINPEAIPSSKMKQMELDLEKRMKSQEAGVPSILPTSNTFQSTSSDSSAFAEPSSSVAQTLSSSEQREIRENARRQIEQQERKKENKQQKQRNASCSSDVLEDSASVQSATSSATTGQIYLLNRRWMRIYEKLWEPNSTDSNGEDWANRSFRNDINMTRQECLKLIIALGGNYTAERGHGSHLVAKLPKIEMNGVDVGGLVDYETGELMITLTNEEVLKHYQIRQLRKILISQGFTPDRVKAKGQE